MTLCHNARVIAVVARSVWNHLRCSLDSTVRETNTVSPPYRVLPCFVAGPGLLIIQSVKRPKKYIPFYCWWTTNRGRKWAWWRLSWRRYIRPSPIVVHSRKQRHYRTTVWSQANPPPNTPDGFLTFQAVAKFSLLAFGCVVPPSTSPVCSDWYVIHITRFYCSLTGERP